MNKLKVLSLISIGLLAVNIILIWFLVSHQPNRSNREGPKRIIIEKLHFDKNQITEYEKLIEWHRTEIRKADKQMLELKHNLYSYLIKEPSTSKDSLIAEIGKLQMAIEHIHFKHFLDIKKLCKHEQQNYFEAFASEITELFPQTKNKQH